MARKETSPAPVHGFNDVIGIALLALTLLLLVALFSYEANDLSANRVPPNQIAHNLGGPIGARVAYGLFFIFGAGAFVLPALLLFFALGYLFQFFSYLRHRWIWAAVLFFCSLGLLDLYTGKIIFLDGLAQKLNAPSAGGSLGLWSNNLFKLFGMLGATIIFGALGLISLLFLTNFQLGQWLRTISWKKSDAVGEISAKEKFLARQARDVEKQTGKLEERLEKSGPILS
ncbi:MAG: DNA translocase FtsK 4TM domain-containing protein, partial [Limisphaerales bacterium]